jgi:hypothetical protein
MVLAINLLLDFYDLFTIIHDGPIDGAHHKRKEKKLNFEIATTN